MILRGEQYYRNGDIWQIEQIMSNGEVILFCPANGWKLYSWTHLVKNWEKVKFRY